MTGTNSALKQYSVSDMSSYSGSNVFVIRVYSTTDTDAFNVLFYKDTTYTQLKVEIKKSGWQELVIPVSDITTKFSLSEITSFVLNKGGWNTQHNKSNVLYFDSMWFENRSYNTAVDADNPILQVTSNGGTMGNSTTKVYPGSDSSISWYLNSNTSNRSLTSVNFSDINLDSTKYNKVTLRLYSEQADKLNIALNYNNGIKDTNKYTLYEFSEANNNIGKWVELEIDYSDVKSYKFTNIMLNWNGWNQPHTATNNLYIDKIWFGDVEDKNTTFSFIGADVEGSQSVGVFDIIRLEFSDYLAENVECDAVTITRNGSAVTEFDVWADKNVLCIKTKDAMVFDSPYEITVTQKLKDQRGYTLYPAEVISFTTKLPYLAIDEVKITDMSGNKLSALPIGNTPIKAECNIMNGSESEEKFVLLLAMFDKDKKMVDVALSEEKTYPENGVVAAKIATLEEIVTDTNIETIKAFLWSDLGRLIPYKMTEIK